ncbi:MAG: signal recognition particle-docking protein FtsY [Eubacterium sp.]|nr:signal recognition particle-docking protein FtsY [Eubacterium sp.]
MGFFQRLKEGLKKTSMSIANVFKVSEIDEDFYDALEETLIGADMGVETTERVMDELREKVEQKNLKDAEYTKSIIMESLMKQMAVDPDAYRFEEERSVVFVIGVNGVGKTTSIGKLAAKYKARGKKVMIAAGDTFRAGAVEQVRTWANRAGAELIAQGEGGDPSAVVFDAVSAARARNTDILLIDTAGRLHNKKNLMDELGKMRRIISREYPEAYVETLIVLDGSTGQNALEQAKQFSNVTEINGIVLTKLDGTAKGGIAVAIESELNVPVKYIGVGEKVEDMERFDAKQYITALFEDFTMPAEADLYVSSAYDLEDRK